MARTDIRGPQDPDLQGFKSRLSSDPSSLSRSKKDTHVASTTSPMETRLGPNHSGVVPSPLDVHALQGPSPFPEFTSNSQALANKEHRGIRSTKITPSTTPNESPWKLDTTPLFSVPASDEPSDGTDHRSQKSKPMKPKVHIKPMLRKMSREDAPSTSIDLSRSSTEQEGLGIYMNLDRDRRHSESLTGMPYRRTPSGLHHRSTSGTSQFSMATGSSGSKRGSQYVYPMRPTQRAHTPSLSQSYQTSVHDSDEQEGGSPEAESRILDGSEAQRPARATSGTFPRLSLQIEDDSFTHLPDLSQTNIASRSSFHHSQDNGSALDTASPMSRSSLDFVFRSRTRTSTDPISRAATIQAARQAFEEKEAAKARRLEKQQIKAEEKQTRRRGKRNQPDGQQSHAARSSDKLSEKPRTIDGVSRPRVHDQQPSASWKSQSKSTWVLFMTWLRTRVFKIRRKLRNLT